MSLTPQVLTALGGVADDIDADGYDEIVLSTGQHSALAAQVLQGGLPSFDGVMVISSQYVPPGLGILRRAGRVVGVIDFANGKLVLLGKAT